MLQYTPYMLGDLRVVCFPQLKSSVFHMGDEGYLTNFDDSDMLALNVTVDFMVETVESAKALLVNLAKLVWNEADRVEIFGTNKTNTLQYSLGVKRGKSESVLRMIQKYGKPICSFELEDLEEVSEELEIANV